MKEEAANVTVGEESSDSHFKKGAEVDTKELGHSRGKGGEVPRGKEDSYKEEKKEKRGGQFSSP